jgi:hypothetical protein
MKGEPGRRHESWKITLLVNSWALLFGGYGLKCILTRHGAIPEGSRIIMGSFYLVHVTGRAAIWAGLGYLWGGVCAFAAALPRRDETRGLRSLRVFVQWAALLAIFAFWRHAYKIASS